ncbi:MAG TPA: type II secretion system protein [Phycisphaerales bacterium]|nr:type II secretion system protein [Phycisphaerales bacterium]HRQ76086.1 type II secretion system protein [Phycisphaerales bacterium]
MNTHRFRAFTIIELLVVVSIIALLMGILLPALGKAREGAHLTRSQSNLRQLVVAHATYGAEWKDNQWTTVDHSLSRYGANPTAALAAYSAPPPAGTGAAHPQVFIGFNDAGWYTFNPAWAGPNGLYEPIQFPGFGSNAGFGYFRVMNVQNFSAYLSGRFYDPVFYAPKDRIIIDAIGDCWDVPGAFCNPDGGNSGNTIFFSSYALSPAALFNPQVLSRNASTNLYYTSPWSIPSGLRVPTFSQSRYPDLKTHMIEIHWLQNNRRSCNPNFTGCEPYYFNHWVESVPVTAFYDGHIEGVGIREVAQADRRSSTPLWSRNTPFGSSGWFNNLGWQSGYWINDQTSFHILTVDGILGRDTLSN